MGTCNFDVEWASVVLLIMHTFFCLNAKESNKEKVKTACNVLVLLTSCLFYLCSWCRFVTRFARENASLSSLSSTGRLNHAIQAAPAHLLTLASVSLTWPTALSLPLKTYEHSMRSLPDCCRLAKPGQWGSDIHKSRYLQFLCKEKGIILSPSMR